MKKNILIIVAGFMINACIGYGVPIPLVIHLSIGIEDIKDPRVKTIKITLENLDGIETQYSVSDNVIILKRYSKPEIIDEKYIYFENPVFGFSINEDAKNLDKKRTYELKMYVNDKMFFTKKVSFTHTGNDSFDIEFDNYWGLEITDADIKKWFQKKP